VGTFAEVAKIREMSSPQSQEGYVKAVLEANQKVVADACKARDLAEETKDLETQDLMIGRITLHQKTIWMLKSFLK
jgi:starvation-inducible DNA-binding protein